MPGSELNTPPIIIYGAPRSGTTYLERILNQHPDVFISHETRIFAWVHHSLASMERDEMVLSYRPAFKRHVKRNLRPMIRRFYSNLAPGVRFWGDKNPHYASLENRGCLDTILELFPNARFLHIYRDGRDVVASLLNKSWADFETAHRIWINHLDVGSGFGSKLDPSQYFELRYESLIQDDEAVSELVFDFLGIEMVPAVREFCNAQAVSRTPFSEPTRDLTQVVGGSAWYTELSAEQQIRSLELIGSHLVKYGYETEGSLEVMLASGAKMSGLV